MPSAVLRTFCVHDRAREVCHARLVVEPSFEAAAIAYLESHPITVVDSGAVTLIVRETDSGQERCFRIDLANGLATPCA